MAGELEAVARRYTPLYEGMLLRYAALVAAQRFVAETGEAGPVCIVEIGVGSGVSSNEMVSDLGHRRVVSNYIGIDSMIEDPTDAIQFEHPGMVLLQGDSTDPEIIAQVPGPIHMLFVDGDHSYSGAKADVLHYGPLVGVGYLMVMHDVIYTGARQVLEETLQSPCWELHFAAHEQVQPNDLTPGIAILERVQ